MIAINLKCKGDTLFHFISKHSKLSVQVYIVNTVFAAEYWRLLARLYKLTTKFTEGDLSNFAYVSIKHAPDLVDVLDEINTIRYEGKLDLRRIRLASELARDLQRLYNAHGYGEIS